MKKIGILGFMLILLSGCYAAQEQLLYNISQDNANRILFQLQQHGINAHKELQKDGSFNISVPNEKQTQALQILDNIGGGLTPEYTNLGSVFKKDGFISSPLEEHARLEYALDQEISAMLSEIGGVIVVKTEVGLPAPNDNLWQSSASEPTVAVLIKYRSGSEVTLYASKVKSLVSHSIPGLSVERVDVLMVEQKDDKSISGY